MLIGKGVLHLDCCKKCMKCKGTLTFIHIFKYKDGLERFINYASYTII